MAAGIGQTACDRSDSGSGRPSSGTNQRGTSCVMGGTPARQRGRVATPCEAGDEVAPRASAPPVPVPRRPLPPAPGIDPAVRVGNDSGDLDFDAGGDEQSRPRSTIAGPHAGDCARGRRRRVRGRGAQRVRWESEGLKQTFPRGAPPRNDAEKGQILRLADYPIRFSRDSPKASPSVVEDNACIAGSDERRAYAVSFPRAQASPPLARRAAALAGRAASSSSSSASPWPSP